MLTITAHILPPKPRPVDRCHDTGRVVIGLAHQRPLAPIDTRDALTLQRALLDPRTAHPPGLLGQLFGGLYKWI